MDDFIGFCNLKRQYNDHREDFLHTIDLVCGKAAFIDGDFVKLFESEFAKFCQVSYVSCVNSGTNAILLAMLAMGIKAGNEVIIPANTFVATAWGPLYTGAKPVFTDCTSDTWEIDPLKMEEAITGKTKAVIGVHLYGLPFDIDAVTEIARNNNLMVVEDCAQAHGALFKNRPVGGLCDVGAFSFYPTKNLGAFGEGGCVTTNNEDYIEQINSLKKHAVDAFDNHEKIGFNMRMDGIQAAILSYKLKHLESLNLRRKELAKRFTAEIFNPCIKMQKIPKDAVHAYHLFVITVPEREKFIKHLYEKNIECAIHYRVPCHLQKVFAHLGYKPGDLPNSEYLSEHCVSLPMYPELQDDEVSRIIDACNSFDRGVVF
ncbi:MAG: DegT/DnrJ/EryC1/StrS family aminotransferase [Eubacteriales bacterium]